MVQFRNQEKEILFKVVYYGPALCGKTTNVETLHQVTDPEDLVRVTSLKTAEDRTLFFDLLPFDLGEIQGYHIRIQIYTVPGQVHYNTTRKIVLSGADTIVFVADSQTERLEENYISWENMKANMLANKMNIDEMPIIIQCNKQDLPGIASPDKILQEMRVPATYRTITACAVKGDGVVDTFRLAVSESLALFAGKFKLIQKGVTREKIDESVQSFFEPFEAKRLAAKAGRHKPIEATVPLKGLSEEEQLVAALRSTTEIAEQYNEVDKLSKLYEARLKEMTLLYDLGISISSQKDLNAVTQIALATLSKFKPAWIFSLFSISGKEPEPLICLGAKEDPLVSLGKGPAGNIALGLIEKRESAFVNDLSERIEETAGIGHVIPETVTSLFFGDKDEPLYSVFAYTPKKEMIKEDEKRFLSLFEKMVSQRVSAITMLSEIAKANNDLERKVLERTAALSQALEKLKELDNMKKAFLNSASHEMKTPLTNIRSYSDFLIRHPEQFLEKGKEYLSIIRDESEKLDNLVTALLSFSHVKEPVRGDPCELNEVLDNVLHTLSSKIKAKKIQVLLKKDNDSLIFPINKEDATVFMQQIIDNAVKFTPDGTTVKVFLMDDPKRVIFSVRDYGEGFKDEKPPISNEDILTAVPALDNGLGMGLFLVREVLRKYSGTIHIDAMAPGTNVLIELPKD
jgi:mutual gliding-motility protein MglA